MRALRALGFERAVIVQPSVYGTDNRCTYDAVRQSGGKWRGVAVVHAEVTRDELQALHEAGFRGVRINLLFKGGLAMEVLEKMARRIEPWGWHLQLLVDGRDLVDLAPRLRQLPVPSVIDHMGHLPAALTVKHPAFAALLSLVRAGRCWVKLSGAYRISRQAVSIRRRRPHGSSPDGGWSGANGLGERLATPVFCGRDAGGCRPAGSANGVGAGSAPPAPCPRREPREAV